MYSSPTLNSIRRVTRKLGLNQFISRFLSRGGYEDKFGPELLSQINSGDCVWDIGANVGLYSVSFAERVGNDGKVFAFEPVEACFREIEKRAKINTAIQPLHMAIGAEDGELAMSLADDELAATHQVATDDDSSNAPGNPRVTVRSVTSLVAEHPDMFPNVIKIDVEGYEGAVFDGMIPLFSDTRLRCIGVEVHFGLLQDRGEGSRPKMIENALKDGGFAVRWSDPSHLIATR